ncbi:hypothetical protein [Ruminococcus sp. Marseille-P6503]|uniref:hypothetical protein n=1 Tax=Ruminococcus sp. Marseille-P6503 TaxID=2364796 RepID=UPI000F522A33|nr:hypothetical protein [Ruminococcus sp. Marseille-P6503]
MSEKFEYTYSAKQQEELENIRRKYLPREETKMEKLRRLDESAARPGTLISIIVGIAGTLIMGFGMCLCLEWAAFIPGVITGIAGMAVLASAYPIYSRITRKRREKLAPEILRLTEEISKGS